MKLIGLVTRRVNALVLVLTGALHNMVVAGATRHSARPVIIPT